jgi:hypothetical protein
VRVCKFGKDVHSFQLPNFPHFNVTMAVRLNEMNWACLSNSIMNDSSVLIVLSSRGEDYYRGKAREGKLIRR